jgi:hypothetical protein
MIGKEWQESIGVHRCRKHIGVVTYRSLTNPTAWRAYAEIAKLAISEGGFFFGI